MKRWFILCYWVNETRKMVEKINSFEPMSFSLIEDAKTYAEEHKFDKYEIYEYTVLKVWEHHTVEEGRG